MSSYVLNDYLIQLKHIYDIYNCISSNYKEVSGDIDITASYGEMLRNIEELKYTCDKLENIFYSIYSKYTPQQNKIIKHLDVPSSSQKLLPENPHELFLKSPSPSRNLLLNTEKAQQNPPQQNFLHQNPLQQNPLQQNPSYNFQPANLDKKSTKILLNDVMIQKSHNDDIVRKSRLRAQFSLFNHNINETVQNSCISDAKPMSNSPLKLAFSSRKLYIDDENDNLNTSTTSFQRISIDEKEPFKSPLKLAFSSRKLYIDNNNDSNPCSIQNYNIDQKEPLKSPLKLAFSSRKLYIDDNNNDSNPCPIQNYNIDQENTADFSSKLYDKENIKLNNASLS